MFIESENYGGRYETVLDGLSGCRVMCVRYDKETDCFRLTEACDEYYSVLLDRSQMLELARELTALALAGRKEGQ